MRILVVDDDPKLAGLLRRGLTEKGNATDVAGRGEDALWMARANHYDAIVLDVMLPGLDGFQTCAALRKADVWAPVLLLTARDAIQDRVFGLDAGADDYLVKPFAFAATAGFCGVVEPPDAIVTPPTARAAHAASAAPSFTRRPRMSLLSLTVDLCRSR